MGYIVDSVMSDVIAGYAYEELLDYFPKICRAKCIMSQRPHCSQSGVEQSMAVSVSCALATFCASSPDYRLTSWLFPLLVLESMHNGPTGFLT